MNLILSVSLLSFFFKNTERDFAVIFDKCCKYPTLVMLDVDYQGCVDGCKTMMNVTEVTPENYGVFDCCTMTCFYEKSGFIANGEYVSSGLISSFGASVDFDTSWMNILESTVRRCFDTIPFDIKFDCVEGITQDYINVVMCAFLQLFLQCPYSTGLESCKWAIKYVEECYKY